MGCVLQGVTIKSFVYECSPRVLFMNHREDGRGDDSCGEVLRRGGWEHAAETKAQVGS